MVDPRHPAFADDEPPRWPRGVWIFWAAPLAVLVLATLYAVSVPGGDFLIVLALIFGWPAYLGIAVVAAVTDCILMRSMRLRRAYLITAAATCATVLLVAADLPFRARFQLSQPAMDRAARAAVADGSSPHAGAGRIGLWNVSSVRVIGNDVEFDIDGAGFMDTYAFRYAPAARPVGQPGNLTFEHVRGRWYVSRTEF